VEAIANTSRELLQALDEIVWVVNPRNDDLEHLAGYLEQYAQEYFQPTPVDCEVSVPRNLPAVPLPAEVRHNVFLAFEEALGNVLKHAGASRVEIAMSPAPDGFEIRVDDDGLGMPPRPEPDAPGHDGLANMNARLDAAGGWCRIGPSPAGGTRVQLHFAFQPAAAGTKGAPP
jgi:signal transduction histidine kinase